jgi:hypothetical protein
MAKIAKAIVAVITAGLIALAAALTEGVSSSEWITIILALLGALTVYLVPNAQADQPVRDVGGY